MSASATQGGQNKSSAATTGMADRSESRKFSTDVGFQLLI